jgi:YesN/AraC family two-component response regulator
MQITVDDKKSTMNAGDFAVISPFSIHGFHTPEYVRRWICVFSDDFLPTFVSRNEINVAAENCVFHADEKLLAFLKGRLPDNKEELVEMNSAEIRLIGMIVACVFEEYLRKVKIKPMQKNKALVQILLYIQQHYTEDLTLKSIGNAIGYSPKYISNCISCIKNYNLPLLVNSLRIDHAKHLLLNTNLKIINIGEICGYNNEKSFYNAFRAITNTTPREYRNAKRQSKQTPDAAD